MILAATSDQQRDDDAQLEIGPVRRPHIGPELAQRFQGRALADRLGFGATGEWNRGHGQRFRKRANGQKVMKKAEIKELMGNRPCGAAPT